MEKASRENIARLVLEAEATISQEQQSWTSTASKEAEAALGEAGKEDSSGLNDGITLEAAL